ncbi:sigma-70 family RNA polymerase sigma factor [Nannocystis sp. ILAH1]|uniref:RNA polymerase sigma factor n=1 Tax=Nannocystis sp. ILAH1 TaxID=2996789 RepID=UPI002270879C|nr:sigma-70 family RNA polymerase sigma factor [Nannocystis sp. ILAH1]MCY0994299.1 sigma-70 family RNA polymerase sigma factor [Nannocystis sp. ILAH1]
MSKSTRPEDQVEAGGPRAAAMARNDEDLALLAAWRAGDARAGDGLVRHYGPQVVRFFADKARDFEVDDLAQQTWEALTHARDRFVVPGEEVVAGEPIAASFRAYLYGTARFVLFAHYRKKTRAAQFDPSLSSLEDLSPSPSRLVSAHAKLERLSAALRKLPLDLQILLELRYAQEMTSAEIAAVYEIPKNTAKSRLRVAKERLDAQLARLGLGPAPG